MERMLPDTDQVAAVLSRGVGMNDCCGHVARLLFRCALPLLAIFAGVSIANAATTQPWPAAFDRIQDPVLKQRLQAYQREGWSNVVARLAKGRSRADLQIEGEMHIAQLQAAIAADNAYLAKMKTSSRIANVNACRAARTRTLRVACDVLERTNEIDATNGLLQIVPIAVPAVIAPVAHFGSVRGPSVAQTVVTVRSVSSAMTKIAVPPKHPIVIGPNTRTFALTVGQSVVIDSGQSVSTKLSGFSVTPATGVLQVTPGTIHVESSEFAYMKAVGTGTVTIHYYGPSIKRRAGTCAGLSTSTNWSGYVVNGGPFVGVTGTWIVPTIPSNSSSGMSSTWIGIDGCNESQLIQTGTEQDIAAGLFAIGGTSYNAWWEVLPQFGTSQSINNPVLPGDLMTASIAPAPGVMGPNTNSSFIMTLTDISGGWSFSTTQLFNAPLDEAEWIEEATSVCAVGCSVSALANYQTVTFDGVPSTLSDTLTPQGSSAGNPGLSAGERVSMVPSGGGNNFSTPSNPDCDTDGFTAVPGLVPPVPPGPLFASTVLPQGINGTPYSQPVQIVGASGVSWNPNSAPFAPGLTFNNGAVGGVPTSNGLFALTLTASDSANSTRSCSASVALNVAGMGPTPTPAPIVFNTVTITILTGNDDLRSDSDVQVNFSGLTGWPGTMCLVQGNSHNLVGGSACTAGTPDDWSGPINNWGGFSAWSTHTESKSGLNLQWTGSGSMTFTFTTHNTGCSNPFGGCGSANDNWDIQAMSVVLNPGNLTLFSVGNFSSPHNSGQCFWRIKPPGGTDPSSTAVTWSFPPNPGGNGCPSD
jgi:hypothetical protein